MVNTKYKDVLVDCNLCGGNDYRTVSEVGLFGDRVFNVMCKNCGLIYQNPRKHIRTLEEYYKTEYWPKFEKKGNYVDAEDLISKREEKALIRIDFLESVVRVRDSCLEIGCASGEFLDSLKKKYSQLRTIGVELSDRERGYATNRGLEVCDNNFMDIEFQEQFDLIALFHVIEHFEDPTAALTKIRFLLKDDGHVFIEVPLLDNYWMFTMERFFRIDHYYSFSRYTFSKLLEKCGFATVKIDDNYHHVRSVLRKAPKKDVDLVDFDLCKNIQLFEKWRQLDRRRKNIFIRAIRKGIKIINNLTSSSSHVRILY